MPISSATGPFTITILLGALLATPYALFAASSRRPAVPFGIGLAVASLLYLVFAAFGPAAPSDLRLETLGLLFFGSVAVAGVRWFPPLLAAGWTAHVAWDLLLHPVSAQESYAPWWYPVLCIGFDLLVAGCLLGIHRHRLPGALGTEESVTADPTRVTSSSFVEDPGRILSNRFRRLWSGSGSA